MKKTIVTTSWDDGNKLDLKLAGLLEKYQIRGTFYIPKEYKQKTLSDEQIQGLAKKFEVGAHTISHADLTALTIEEAKKEIFGSKNYLENLLGKNARMFCYPKGRFNEEIKAMVGAAGFLGARTVEDFLVQMPDDLFEFGTTLHAYPFPFRSRVDFLSSLEPLKQNLGRILKLGLPLNSFFGWTNLAKNLFNHTLKNGEVFHLWGHSWEIEKYGMWQGLEEILKYIAGRRDVLYLTNSQALEKV